MRRGFIRGGWGGHFGFGVVLRKGARGHMMGLERRELDRKSGVVIACEVV